MHVVGERRECGGLADDALDPSVAPLLEQLVLALQSLPRGQTLEWACSIPKRLPAPVDQDDFNNTIGNLLENLITLTEGDFVL